MRAIPWSGYPSQGYSQRYLAWQDSRTFTIVGTPLGDFIRARRDNIQPDLLGLPSRNRRRSPGRRRLDLAARAGVSVEYLARIEQGRDRNPSSAVVNAIADALSLAASERNHLRYLAKITSDECSANFKPAPPDRQVRSSVLRTLNLLEPGIAIVTNRLGDILAHTRGYESVTRGTGLLDDDPPNIRPDLIIPTGKRKGKNPSLASIYRALTEHEKAQAHPDAIEAAHAEFAAQQAGT